MSADLRTFAFGCEQSLGGKLPNAFGQPRSALDAYRLHHARSRIFGLDRIAHNTVPASKKQESLKELLLVRCASKRQK